ncbi:MAG: hypothetical protein GXO22_01250 [Aquificae bacterium]|nr:hypothetical protein [Aquificota bacterium]
MKTLLSIFLFLSMFSFSFAVSNKFGLGIVIGTPTGLTGKYWIDKHNAMDFATGWSFREDRFYLHFNYLIHNYGILKKVSQKSELKGDIPLYAGIGLRAKFGKGSDEIGFRIPLGITYLFASMPLDTFLEFAPSLNFYPETDFFVDASLGIRYYF